MFTLFLFYLNLFFKGNEFLAESELSKNLPLQDELVNPYCDELHTFVTSTNQNIQSASLSTLGTIIKYEKLSKVSWE